jgi:hypothetical protein
MAWTIAITLALMLWVRFDRLILEIAGHTGPDVEGVEDWQRVFFLYMRGLDVRALQKLGNSTCACLFALFGLSQGMCANRLG